MRRALCKPASPTLNNTNGSKHTTWHCAKATSPPPHHTSSARKNAHHSLPPISPTASPLTSLSLSPLYFDPRVAEETLKKVHPVSVATACAGRRQRAAGRQLRSRQSATDGMAIEFVASMWQRQVGANTIGGGYELCDRDALSMTGLLILQYYMYMGPIYRRVRSHGTSDMSSLHGRHAKSVRQTCQVCTADMPRSQVG